MLFLLQLVALASLVLIVYCALSVITTPADQVRNLPKLLWLLVVLLFPLAGSIAWLLAGRPQRTLRPGGLPGKANPGRAVGPEDDAWFQEQLRKRVEEQRRRAREREGGPEAPPSIS